MTDSDLKAHNDEKLTELYPVFQPHIQRVIDKMLALGYRCRIQCAWRSPADQLHAYVTGHSQLKYGMHNATGKNGEKEALAVDMLNDDLLFAAPPSYYVVLANVAASEGLITGIRWGLPDTILSALKVAIASCDKQYSGKIGWDPSHIQYEVQSIEVQKGWRPK